MRLALATLALLLLSPPLYYGAYRSLLLGKRSEIDFETRVVSAEKPMYVPQGRFWEAFFAPAHAFDKFAWPDDWEGEHVLER